MKTHKIIFWMCIVVAGILTYGKYFVATTELGKMDASITAMLFILFGIVVNGFGEINTKLENIIKVR